MNGKETTIHGDIENQQEVDILNFPSDSVFKPNVAEGNREGKVKVFSKAEKLLAILNYENNMLNGLCEFYENGKVNKQLSFVNGKLEGWCKEGNKEFIYENNNKEFELVNNEKLEGCVNEINIKTGKINRCYKMNENHKPVGVGYVFQDGTLVRKVQYKENKEPIVLIEIKEEMTERDVFGNILYQGEYQIDNDNFEFLREGYGMEKTSGVSYEGYWKENRKEGFGKISKGDLIIFDGKWLNNVPEGEGCLYNADGKEICSGNWVKGMCSGWKWNENENRFDECKIEVEKKNTNSGLIIFFIVFGGLLVLLLVCLIIYLSKSTVVTDSSTLKSVLSNKRIKELEIGENSCNDLEDDLLIENYPNLQSIIVKKNSLQNLNSFKICNCEKLRSFEVEDWAFENIKNVTFDSNSNYVYYFISS